MREGRRRPSLGTTNTGGTAMNIAAMREGRRRPSLAFTLRMSDARNCRRNEGGAPAPLVANDIPEMVSYIRWPQ